MRRRLTIAVLALLLLSFCLGARAEAEGESVMMRYAANDGVTEALTEIPVRRTHLRLNTATGELFQREGYTLYAWNTQPDGSGVTVGLGSRTEHWDRILFAQWAKWSDSALFEVENGAVTAYTGGEETVVVPAAIRGEAIRAIAEGAFRRCPAKTVILPPSLRSIAFGSFEGAALETLVLFDSLQSVSDYAFRGCAALRTLRLNAVGAPVYAGSYFSTFADKFDRLLFLKGGRKLVLFSGSSARFGYDSAALDAAFPDYAVVNMGVFAYTNALPQLELIRRQLQPGDILLISPELDAAKRQFCTTNALDAPFFSLMEGDYDQLAALDLREYTLVFSSLSQYLSIRAGMERRSWEDSPADFDEDGAPVHEASYNAYGDYILYRPNADSDEPLYGLEVPYTASYYRKELYIDPFNAELSRFTADGVRVYMTYSPRNRLAVTEESTEAEIRALDRYFRDTLSVPVISDIFDSLVDGRYLSGTDNHLSTEGVRLRTRQVIRDLSAALRRDGVALSGAPRGEKLFSALRPLALGLFTAALALTALGNWRSALPWLGGLCWAGGAVFAWLAGLSLRVVLALTLLLLSAAGRVGKEGGA